MPCLLNLTKKMQMIQIATNKEQSARLTACGVDPKSADMGRIIGGLDGAQGFQEICNIKEYEYWNGPVARGLCAGPDGKPLEIQPPLPYKTEYAWSLSALLAMLPKKIRANNTGSYYLSLTQEMPINDDYRISYKACWCPHDDDLIYKQNPCPIEACVQMVEWLTANDYKLNEI